jgi:hypothetical protein
MKRGIDEHLYRCNWYAKVVMGITTKRDAGRYNESVMCGFVRATNGGFLPPDILDRMKHLPN